jgi:hypothetical protein
LTAELAVQRPPEVRGNLAVHSALDKAQFVLALHFIANAHAHAALDAEVHVVADKVRIIVHVKVPRFPGKRQLRHLVFMDQILQLTIPARVATRA